MNIAAIVETKKELVNEILDYIEKTSLLKNENKTHLLLACFLQHMYETKEKFVPVNTLRKIIHDCRDQTIDLDLTERALDRLVGFRAIDRYNTDELSLTTTGKKVVKHPRFIELHQ